MARNLEAGAYVTASCTLLENDDRALVAALVASDSNRRLVELFNAPKTDPSFITQYEDSDKKSAIPKAVATVVEPTFISNQVVFKLEVTVDINRLANKDEKYEKLALAASDAVLRECICGFDVEAYKEKYPPDNLPTWEERREEQRKQDE